MQYIDLADSLKYVINQTVTENEGAPEGPRKALVDLVSAKLSEGNKKGAGGPISEVKSLSLSICLPLSLSLSLECNKKGAAEQR
jgi:hypothetical protein